MTDKDDEQRQRNDIGRLVFILMLCAVAVMLWFVVDEVGYLG